MKWIKIKDKLPEPGIIVLGWGGHTTAWPVIYNDIFKMWFDASEKDEDVVGLTHWMPLPTKPEDEHL